MVREWGQVIRSLYNKNSQPKSKLTQHHEIIVRIVFLVEICKCNRTRSVSVSRRGLFFSKFVISLKIGKSACLHRFELSNQILELSNGPRMSL
jgi:hypothetical protein